MDTTDPLQVAAVAAQGFPLLQCEQCSNSIRKALVATGHNGQEIELRGGAGKPFIVCLSYHGGSVAISQNGRHVGIRVGNIIFDNLHPNGIPYGDWLQGFDALGGVVVFRIDDF